MSFLFLFLFKIMNRVRSDSIPNMYKTDDDILARAAVETWTIKAEKGAQDCCPKCDGRVFEAEKMVTASVSHLLDLKFMYFLSQFHGGKSRYE